MVDKVHIVRLVQVGELSPVLGADQEGNRRDGLELQLDVLQDRFILLH